MTRYVNAGKMEVSVREIAQLSVASRMGKLNKHAGLKRDDLSPSAF